MFKRLRSPASAIALLLALCVSQQFDTVGADSATTSGKPVSHEFHEFPAIRSYFYVGGGYVDIAVNNTIYADQMYVEQLTPKEGVKQPYPLIMIHGQAQTGTNWLNKPDGTRGWASYFIDHGYEIYIIDQTLRGRSPYNPASNITLTTYSVQIVQQRWTDPQAYDLWPQAALHTQWPGNGSRGDPIFDAFYKAQFQWTESPVIQETLMQAAGAELLDKVGPAVLLSHSQGGLFPWLFADARPDMVKAIVSIEPTGPPFQDAVFSTTPARPWGLTDIPLTYNPATTNTTAPLQTQVIKSTTPGLIDCIIQADPARQLTNLLKIPVLVDQGEASYHAPYDYCTVMFLKQAGVHVEFLRLADIGIHGNGHFQFMEKNSNLIAEVLNKWIKKTVKSQQKDRT